MAPAPIVVRCECGVETRGRSGDVIRCAGCGLRYDTAEHAQYLERVAALTQRRFKLLGRIGVGFVGFAGLFGLYLLSVPGLAIGALGMAAVWYGGVMRFAKPRLAGRAGELAPPITPDR